jgi:hypothetical protein
LHNIHTTGIITALFDANTTFLATHSQGASLNNIDSAIDWGKKREHWIIHYQGIIFDTLLLFFIIGSTSLPLGEELLSLIIGTEADGDTGKTFENSARTGIFLSLIFALYFVGIYLKHWRLAKREQVLLQNGRIRTKTYTRIVFFLAYLQTSLFFFIALGGLAYPVSSYEMDDKVFEGLLQIPAMLAFILAAVPSFFTLRGVGMIPGYPVKLLSDDDWRMRPSVEIFANMLLFIVSIIIVLMFWETSVAYIHSQEMTAFLALLSTLGFCIFYISPRLIFFLEDYRYPLTYLQITLVIISLVARIMS